MSSPVVRRTFLASLFAPLMPWRKLKVLDSSTEKSQKFPEFRPLNTFCELPEGPITGVLAHMRELYAFTSGGVYRIYPNGCYRKLDPAPFVMVQPIGTFHRDAFTLVYPKA